VSGQLLDSISKAIFFVALVASEVIRVPHRTRTTQDRIHKRIVDDRKAGLEVGLMTLGFVGLWVAPAVHVLSPWLGFADYRLPASAGLLGAAACGVGLWLLWRSHADLGRNWSPTLEIKEGHALVTGGAYRHIRHPIYAATWLLGLGQALLLQNWVAGLAGLASFLPIYLLRVPREEQMMLDHFGEEYRVYVSRTGRLIPRVWR